MAGALRRFQLRFVLTTLIDPKGRAPQIDYNPGGSRGDVSGPKPFWERWKTGRVGLPPLPSAKNSAPDL